MRGLRIAVERLNFVLNGGRRWGVGDAGGTGERAIKNPRTMPGVGVDVVDELLANVSLVWNGDYILPSIIGPCAPSITIMQAPCKAAL